MSKKRLKIIVYFASMVVFGVAGPQLLMIDIDKNSRDVNGTVIEKIETFRSHHRSSRVSSEFIMVVKEDNGNVCDLKVTPSTYATHDVGSKISFTNIDKRELNEDVEIRWQLFGLLFICIAVLQFILGFAIF